MTEINRTARKAETRDTQKRTGWQQASTLPDPDPRPGLVHRWIATAILGQADPVNVSKKMREYWEPCKATDYPEVSIPGDKNGNIEVGGLMLCASPMEIQLERNAHYAKQAQALTDSVDTKFLGQSDPRMPVFSEKKSGVTRGSVFGNGS